nr:dipicolinate synthase subunit B [bacterium]
MNLEGKTVGFAMTGSFCTLSRALNAMRQVAQAGAEIIPILSPIVYESDTRFYTANRLKEEIAVITPHPIIHTIVEAEPVGPKKLLDILIIAPCTGNTLAKLINGIVDTPVLMAAKAQLRNERPVVIAVSSNDGLTQNGRSIGALCGMRHVYVVPFSQDDPTGKPASVVAHFDLVLPCCTHALAGRQLQPILAG